MWRRRNNTSWILLMGFLIFGVVVIGAAVIPLVFDFIPPDISLSLALVATAIITFFGFLWRSEDPPGNEEDMRTAITVSIVTVYLVLIGLVAFLPEEPNQVQLPAITNTMLTSFTAIVGIVVPFYFGASAYVQRNGLRVDQELQSRMEEELQSRLEEERRE
jgi:uncharacterized membrane protein (DUF485 family)